LFSRALSLIYLVAFASFGMQVAWADRVGRDSSVHTYFRIALEQLGAQAYWRVPSIYWWAHSDLALLSIAWEAWHWQLFRFWRNRTAGGSGSFLSFCISITVDRFRRGRFSWGTSGLFAAGGGFLAIFLRPSMPRVWLFQWLADAAHFRVGLVKLTSHDPTWRSLTGARCAL